MMSRCHLNSWFYSHFTSSFHYPEILSVLSVHIVISGWSRGHHIFRTQLWWRGKANASTTTCLYFSSTWSLYWPVKEYSVYVYMSLLCVPPQLLVTASRALLLKQWDWRQAQCTRSWRAIHTVPVASMTFDSTSTLLATGQQLQD